MATFSLDAQRAVWEVQLRIECPEGLMWLSTLLITGGRNWNSGAENGDGVAPTMFLNGFEPVRHALGDS
jgi:hypothetical protein